MSGNGCRVDRLRTLRRRAPDRGRTTAKDTRTLEVEDAERFLTNRPRLVELREVAVAQRCWTRLETDGHRTTVEGAPMGRGRLRKRAWRDVARLLAQADRRASGSIGETSPTPAPIASAVVDYSSPRGPRVRRAA